MNAPFQPQTPLLDLDLLKTLVAIHETGNFSAAAAAVFRTPSAISMQVKKMEEMLGRPVFKRDSRSVELTQDGFILLAHARRVLALNQQVMSRFIEPEVAGTVRLGSLDTAVEQFVPRVLKRFAETHPHVSVDVFVDNTRELVAMVQKGDLDMAIISTPSEGPNFAGAEEIFSEPLVWAGLRGGIAMEQNPVPISVWEEGCVWRKAGLEALERQGINYRISFMSAHVSGQKAGILADMVIAPLPVSCLDDQIVAIDDLPKLPHYGLSMLLRETPAAPVKAVADHLRASFADIY